MIIALNGQGKTRGTVALLRVKATCNQSLVSLCPKSAGELLPEFLLWNLHGRYEEIRRITGDDGNERRGLNMPLIRNIEIPLPPLEEQRRIVAVLGEAFAAIGTATATAETNLANARELLAVQLARILAEVDQLNVVPISEVAFIQEGPGIRKYEYQDDGFPMINVRCVQDGWIDMSKGRAANTKLATGKWRHFQVEEGDILFTTSGTIGRTAIVMAEDLPLLMNTSVVRFRSESSKLLQRYLYHFLRSDLFQRPLARMASGTAIANVGPTHIKTLSVPIPPLSDQKRIIDLLDDTRRLSIKLHEIYGEKLTALEKLKQSLLNRAFSGALTERELVPA